MVEKLLPPQTSGGILDEEASESFEAKVRYLASSLIITIPIKVARELELKLGDKVQIKIQKTENRY